MIKERLDLSILKLNDKEGDDKKTNVPKGFEKFFKKKDEEKKVAEKGD